MLGSSHTYRINQKYNHSNRNSNNNTRDTDSYDSAYTDTTSGLYSDYEKYVQIKSASIHKQFEDSYQKTSTSTSTSADIDDNISTNKRRESSLYKINWSSGEYNLTDSAFQDDINIEQLSQQQHQQNDSSSVEIESNMYNKMFEFEDDNKDILFEKGHIKSATLDAIINYFIQIQEHAPKKFTEFSILLSARVFMPPHKLFKELFNRIIYEPSSYGIYNRENLNSSCKKLIKILSEWTEMFPYDFREQKMMNKYRQITTKCLNMDSDLKDDIIAITSKLLVNMRNLEMYESYLNRIHYEASQKLKKSVVETNVITISEDPRVLAQQLTHIELDRLKHISAEEFIQYCNIDENNHRGSNNSCNQSSNYSSFSTASSSIVHDYDEKLSNTSRTSNNLEAYIQWFNRLSNLITTEIVKHLKRETRVKIINYFIDVAYECYNIGNYNSLMAIIASLNSSCVSRLKKTWAKIDRTRIDALQKYFEFYNNYSVYRNILKSAKQRFKHSNNAVIPLFALVMKDLTSITDGIPNKHGNGHINFEKFWNIAKYISEILNLKNGTCPYRQKSKVINYLLTTPLLTDDACVLASYECEPPETDNERKHRDKLRLKVKETAYFYQSFD